MGEMQCGCLITDYGFSFKGVNEWNFLRNRLLSSLADLKERFDKVDRSRGYQLHREICTISQGKGPSFGESTASYAGKGSSFYKQTSNYSGAEVGVSSALYTGKGPPFHKQKKNYNLQIAGPH
ncbi:uncharacterized protein LOC132054444 [Lycium ferocissimum]|uniref:uncharacterized protein LOC132054444 n=1 Tax=Lycium ferocissimum TaxID=112874 RepID=UPI0028152907|nr:uncharacterized protein LOC132054444 [Lycium ferocissimum]